MKRYKVKEIFGPTIQGEGSKAGTVVLFLRLSGCNRWSGREEDKHKSVCHFCDTDFLGGTMMTAAEIITALQSLGTTDEVVISGGEPMLQLDYALANELRLAGYLLHLETNGSIAIPPELYRLLYHVTVSPKQDFESTLQREATDLKILYPWVSEKVSPDWFARFVCDERFIQAQWGQVAVAVEQVLKTPGYRLSYQLHKILGVQ